jgi:hypothetical protein
MRNALLALGVLSAVVVQPAQAEPPGDAAVAENCRQSTEAAQPERDALRIVRAHFPPPGPRWAHPGPDRMGLGSGPSGLSPHTALATRLAMLETRVGIRAEQLNAWRDYTSALQALVPPPGPHPDDPGERSRENAREPTPLALPQGARDPFEFEEKLADDFAKRAAAAGKLKAAIAALRTTLTREQLDILASTDRLGGPPLGPWGTGDPSKGGAGPGGAPHGKPPLQHVPGQLCPAAPAGPAPSIPADRPVPHFSTLNPAPPRRS